MSGGSYDYAFSTINMFIDACEETLARLETGKTGSEWEEDFEPTALDLASAKERRRFLDHLRKVSEAMRAIEWVDSGDFGPGDEIAPIKMVVGDEKLVDVLDWFRQTVHRAHHEGPLDECPRNTCDAAIKVLARHKKPDQI